MRTDILDLVKRLSASDHKNLSQKSLKLFEEGGELARLVLPYENASGTLHRIVNRRQILEEAVDSLLVALSIAYEMGDDEEIASVMQTKAMYWAALQANEAKVPNLNSIPHEIHVTVSSDYDVDTFRQDCASIGVKPVLLVLHTPTSKARDMMTSQVVMGNTQDAFTAMVATISGLNEKGYVILRSKIESAPWHPSVPTRDNGLKHVSDNYFEAHIEVFVENKSGSTQNIGNLKHQLRMSEFDVHVSANFFKAHEEYSTVMVTLRNTVPTIEDFNEQVVAVREGIKGMGYSISDKNIVEYAIFDSKRDHDREWMRDSR